MPPDGRHGPLHIPERNGTGSFQVHLLFEVFFKAIHICVLECVATYHPDNYRDCCITALTFCIPIAIGTISKNQSFSPLLKVYQIEVASCRFLNMVIGH